MPRVRAVLLVLVVMAGLAAPVLPASATSDPQYVTPQGETVKENAHLARVQLTLRKKAHMRYKIPFRTVAGSAKPGRDYKTTKGTVTIKKGAKSVSVWIPLINDKVIEPTEKFTVKFKRTSRWYALTKNEVTITVLDDEVVKKWSGDITVHVTQHEVQNPTTIDEDWTFVAHLVLKADQWGTSWFPTSASSWTLSGTHVVRGGNADCPNTPDHMDFQTTGAFMANPLSGYPATGQAQYWMKSAAGTVPAVMEAGPISADATSYSYWDYTHTCTEHVSASDISVVFQTHWRTSDPVKHPGTFPLTMHKGEDPTLTVNFTDTYSQQAGWATHSRVTGTLHGS